MSAKTCGNLLGRIRISEGIWRALQICVPHVQHWLFRPWTQDATLITSRWFRRSRGRKRAACKDLEAMPKFSTSMKWRFCAINDAILFLRKTDTRFGISSSDSSWSAVHNRRCAEVLCVLRKLCIKRSVERITICIVPRILAGRITSFNRDRHTIPYRALFPS